MDGVQTTRVEAVSRFVVVETEDGVCECEFSDGKPFFHITVKKWGKQAYRRMLHVWVEILYEFYQLGYTSVFAVMKKDNHKAMHLAAMFGLFVVDADDTHVLLQCDVEAE